MNLYPTLPQALFTTSSPQFAGLTLTSQLTSTVASGTSPFAITSTTVNTNLNADLLDGNHAAAFQVAGSYYSVGGTDVAVADGGTGLSAWTANGILYASGTTTLANSSALTFDGTNFYTSGYAGFGTAAGAIGTPLNINYALSVGTMTGVNLALYNQRAAGGANTTGLGFLVAWQPVQASSTTARTMPTVRGIYGVAGLDTTYVTVAANETVTLAEGGYFKVYGIKGGSHTGTATITTGRGIYISDASFTGSVTLVNDYGLYIDNIIAGSTLNFAIYSAGGQSVHAGNFGIGSVTAPSYAVDVTGDVNCSGAFRSRGTAGINATVTYVDTLLGAKTLTFTKGILTAQV